MKNVLLIGGSGFIGSSVAYLFQKKKYNVTVIDTFSNYLLNSYNNDFHKKVISYRFEKLLKNVPIIRSDARNNFELYDSIKKARPNIVINFAALPIASLSNSLSQEALSSIISTTTNTIEVLKRTNFNGRFIYISSSMVYGNFTKNKVTEDAILSPMSIYGAVKLAGESLVRGFCQKFKIDYSIIRPSAVYGPTDTNYRVAQLFLENAFLNKKLIVKGANSKIDFTHIDDLTKGIFLVATHKNARNQIFNLTRGHARKLIDLHNIVKIYFPSLKSKIENHEKGIPKRGTLDISKAKKLLNYQPSINLERGIQDYYNFLKEIYVKK